jgi:hypothetical protein
MHPGVVDGKAYDLTHALGLQGLGVVDEARQVLGRAGLGEGVGQAEQGHQLGAEKVIGRDRRGPVGAHDEEFEIGNTDPDADGHWSPPLM